MSRHIVATVDEIPPGGRKIVEIGGREIGVFNVDGKYFAVRNRCPHMAGPLCEGYVSGAVSSSEPGEYRFERQGEILRCPWHQWEFDLRNGQSWFDPSRVRVRAYRTRVEMGSALLPSNEVDLDGAEDSAVRPSSEDASEPAKHPKSDDPIRAGAPPGFGGMLPGPYVAETYRVSVERAYVVVDLRR